MPIRSRRQFQSRSRPNRSWSGFASTNATLVPAGTKVLLASLTLFNPNIDETHLRTVGVLGVQTDQTAADEEQFGAMGMIQVNDLALAAGVASIPGPITDIADDGWLMFVPFVQTFEFSTAVGFNPDHMRLYHFDSKAKRRTEEGFGIALVVENAHATFGLQVATIFRSLSMVSGT